MSALSNRKFLLTTAAIAALLLIAMLVVDAWLIINFISQAHSSGDPNADQYIGFAEFLYVIFFFIPAAAVTGALIGALFFVRYRLKKLSQRSQSQPPNHPLPQP